MKSALLVALLLVLCVAQEEQLTYLQLEGSVELSAQQLVERFANQQGEILRKVISHYGEEQIKRWRRANISESVIREKVLYLVAGRKQDLYQDLKRFVEETLFGKLGKKVTI
jgi:bisphosphoglycerate-dependent phosphoglycerate mutase